MLAQRRLHLAVLDVAVACVVERVEGGVDVLLRSIIPEGRDRLAELLLVDRAVAVLIPLTEEIDQLDRVLGKDGGELRRDAHTGAGVERDHRWQRRELCTRIVLIHVLERHLGGAAVITHVLRALQLRLHGHRALTLAQHHIELLVLELARLVVIEHIKDGANIGTACIGEA